MGRSFDRGGRSRKEREHGKRRAFRQAERDREALQAVIQAKKRTQVLAAESRKRQSPSPAIIAAVETAQPPAPDIAVPVVAQAKPGFLAQVFRRFFKKSA
jgi:hypothetical protein